MSPMRARSWCDVLQLVVHSVEERCLLGISRTRTEHSSDPEIANSEPKIESMVPRCGREFRLLPRHTNSMGRQLPCSVFATRQTRHDCHRGKASTHSFFDVFGWKSDVDVSSKDVLVMCQRIPCYKLIFSQSQLKQTVTEHKRVKASRGSIPEKSSAAVSSAILHRNSVATTLDITSSSSKNCIRWCQPIEASPTYAQYPSTLLAEVPWGMHRVCVSTKALSFVRRKPVPVVNVHNGRRPSNLGLPGHSRVRLEGVSGPAAFVSAVAILDGAPSSICFFLTPRIVPCEGIVELRVFHLRSVSIQRCQLTWPFSPRKD